MGQKVNPHGFRVGVIKDWDSRWIAKNGQFADFIEEDNKIRKFLKKKLFEAGISKIEIERTRDAVKLILFSSRARDLTRNEGKVLADLTEDLQNLIGRVFKIEVREIRSYHKDAQLVAEDIGDQLVMRG